MVKPVESTAGGGTDVRLSRKLSRVFEKASAALDFIYFNGDLEDDGVFEYSKAYWPLEESLVFNVMEGGATKSLLEAISTMDKLWGTSATDKPELTLKLRQSLAVIEKLALLLDKRSRCELPFSRQMDKLMNLVVEPEYLSEELVNSFDLVTQRGNFNGRQRKLLRKVLAERENLFSAFEQEALTRYAKAFRELALALDLNEDTVGDLETDLFVDLEWFHTA